MANVEKVFGKFAVEIEGEVKLFDNESEAATAAVMAEQSAEFEARAAAFVAARELDPEGRMTKNKVNVIKDFLAFEATLEDEPDKDKPEEEFIPINKRK
jgi:hypothetical protein